MKRIPIEHIIVGANRRPLRGVKELAASIEEVGLLNPITVRMDGPCNYRLVAGYHRLEACKAIGWLEIDATIVDLTDNQAALAEIDENLCRHDLSDLERAECSAQHKALVLEIHPETAKGVAGAMAKHGSATAESAVAEISALSGRAPRTVREDIQIAESIPQDVRDVLRETPVADNKGDLLTIARQPVEVQRMIADKVASGEAKDVNSVIIGMHKAARITALEAPSMPEGVYPIIYADPPWRYEFAESPLKAIEEKYPTMALEDICALEVPAAENAALFLWSTAPLLPSALRVMEAWGFSYRTCAVWDKENFGMGYWFRNTHELLLVGVRGSIPRPDPPNRPRSVLHEKCGEHSAKPETVRQWIEAMYPTLPRIELFARATAPGWVSWGNQV